MTHIKDVGPFRIMLRNRVQASPPPGMRQGWSEYQVWHGRTIIARHETLLAAERDAEARLVGVTNERSN